MYRHLALLEGDRDELNTLNHKASLRCISKVCYLLLSSLTQIPVGLRRNISETSGYMERRRG
jgi:hypothetical protein